VLEAPIGPPEWYKRFDIRFHRTLGIETDRRARKIGVAGRLQKGAQAHPVVGRPRNRSGVVLLGSGRVVVTKPLSTARDDTLTILRVPARRPCWRLPEPASDATFALTCPGISGSPAGMEIPPLGGMMRHAFIPYGGSRSRHPRLAVLKAHRGRTVQSHRGLHSGLSLPSSSAGSGPRDAVNGNRRILGSISE
jgi:hypothetical protein